MPLTDMGMVESIHLALFHWVLNDVYARINGEGRHAAGQARRLKMTASGNSTGIMARDHYDIYAPGD